MHSSQSQTLARKFHLNLKMKSQIAKFSRRFVFCKFFEEKARKLLLGINSAVVPNETPNISGGYNFQISLYLRI